MIFGTHRLDVSGYPILGELWIENPPLSYPDAGFIDYPEVADEGFFTEYLENTAKDRQHIRLILLAKTQNQQAVILIRRVAPQIREICIQGHENSTFSFTDLDKIKVWATPQFLFVDGKRVVSCCTQ
jgi:hypothetical protein